LLFTRSSSRSRTVDRFNRQAMRELIANVKRALLTKLGTAR